MTRVEWFLAFALAYGFRAFDVEVYYYRILPASDNYGLARHVGTGIDFLMRNVGGNVNEVSGVCLIAKLQVIAPAHAGTTSNDIDDGLQFAVVVGSGFGVRLNHYGAGPQFTGPCACLRDGGGSRHSWRLGCIGVKFPSPHNFYTMLFPVQLLPSHCETTNGVFQRRAFDASKRRISKALRPPTSVAL